MFQTIIFTFFMVVAQSAMAGNIFLAGDSTMSIKADNKRPETGWGEALAKHVNAEHTLINLAKNGRSTRSFLDQGRWQALLDQVKPGDLVLIQFGHNDQKIIDPKRFTDPWRDYRWNLERFIDDVDQIGATALLLNSVARRQFDAQGESINSHAPYNDVAKDVAKAKATPFIDMTALSMQWLNTLGLEDSQRYYLHVSQGHPNYPKGKADDTHLNPLGADAICRLFLNAVVANYPELTPWFTE